ncbi:MAG: hypothetical protein CMQ43_06960 [Gammaproteobacteria bacterium]|jgi:chromosome segregation ATPase|nr:hypothetical protein [Gammaproteobacteria bacterium]MBK80641.1 hypothetical protein [Gammaproteobacteria bacterium]|tara:strand:- start:126 stop:395 length:270 start_codon:yes stop_codon:yes gene_type:complete
MSSDDIKTTLTELHRELERTPDLDEDLRRLLVEVDADIHSVLSARERTESEVESLRGRLEALSADFAAAHPNTEVFFRELVHALGRMGI